jgi:hypothetical protein
MNGTINNVTSRSDIKTTPAVKVPTVSKGPSKFGRIFGGILGGAINLVAPGAGSAIGGFVSSRRDMDWNSIDSLLARQSQQAVMMLDLQHKVHTQSQEFSTVTNLLKAKHDGTQEAIRNFKS